MFESRFENLSNSGPRQQTAARFVILEHDWPFVHWDFLLEFGPVLRAWRLLEPVQRECWIDAQPLPDHRLIYLDYQGPVSGNRGNVHRVVGGTFTEDTDTNGDDATLRIRLQGTEAVTRAILQTYPDGRAQWRFS